MATQLVQPPHGSPAWYHGMVARAAAQGCVLTEVVTLTPELAVEMLHNNPDNRFIRPIKLQQIASDIRAGRWTFNGEPVLISKEGYLNDGQHRCSAVVEANMPIEVLVVFGVDRESRTTVDQGAARGAGDYMSMAGIPNATVVAAIGRFLIAYERSDGKSVSGANAVTNSEIVNRYSHDKTVAVSSTFAASKHKYTKKLATPQVIGFCHAVLSRINPAEAETFMTQVCVGENIRKTDPAFAVREGLFRERVTANEKIHLIFRGWNAFRQRRRLELAKVTGSNLPALI